MVNLLKTVFERANTEHFEMQNAKMIANLFHSIGVNKGYYNKSKHVQIILNFSKFNCILRIIIQQVNAIDIVFH